MNLHCLQCKNLEFSQNSLVFPIKIFKNEINTLWIIIKPIFLYILLYSYFTIYLFIFKFSYSIGFVLERSTNDLKL